MDYFGITLPSGARNIVALSPPLDDFRAKVLISFTAPRRQVTEQTCRNVQLRSSNTAVFVMGDTDRQILDFGNVHIDESKYDRCYQYMGGKNINVIIPPTDTGTTYVVLYHVPYR